MTKQTSTISQTDLVKISGATKQSVNKAINAGHIKTKKVGKKKMVIFDDPLTQLWYEKQISKNIDAPALVNSGGGRINTGVQPDDDDEKSISENLVDLQRQKTIEQIGDIKAARRLKELKYRREREDLIEKESLGAVTFQYLNALNINILDIADMIIDTMIDKVKSGVKRGELIKIMRKQLEDPIKNTKEQIKGRLK